MVNLLVTRSDLKMDILLQNSAWPISQ